jgi:hypothetical protein
VFTLIVSHVRLSMQVDLVRARSVLITPGVARLNSAIGHWLLALGYWPAAYGGFGFTLVMDEGTGR